MRRIMVLFLGLVMMMGLSGCMEARELKERTIIEAIGIDKKDDLYILTMQKFTPDASTGDASGVGGTTASLVQTTGKTVSEAVDKVTHYHGNEVFLGNSTFIIVGREAAKDGLEYVLNFFNTTHEITPEIRCVMAESSAEEIVKAQLNQPQSTSSRVETLLEQNQKNGLAGTSSLRSVMTRLQSEKSEPYMPIIKTTQNAGQEGQLKLAGMAVFKQGKLCDVLSIEETKGVLWATDEIQHTVISVDYESGTASINVLNSDSHMKVDIVDDAPVFHLKVKCKSLVGEVVFPNGGGAQISDIENLTHLVEKNITNTILNSINKVYFKDKSDVFRYSEFIRNTHPAFWEKNKDNWDKLMERSKFEIEVICDIDRPGLESKFWQGS